MRFEGKVALVTGGAQGIGKAAAARFAREGASVAIIDQQDAPAAEVAAELVATGARAIAIGLDVRDRDGCRRAVERTVADLGGVDILVNNAGVMRFSPLLEIDEAEWDLIFDVNCKGILWMAQAAAAVMISQGRGGKIVNIASQAGRRGEGLVLTYCASKAAVISMTQSMALALAPRRINVNAVAPGIVDTPMWEWIDRRFADLLGMEPGEPIEQFVAKIPMGRIETADDVAGTICFLASADADYITQQCYNVDGGNWPS